MLRRVVPLTPLFLVFFACAEPLDPGAVDIQVRADGGRKVETSFDDNTGDTGAELATDSATGPDSGAGSEDTGSKPSTDSAAPDTTPGPDTAPPPDTAVPDTAPADTGPAPDTAPPPADTGTGTTVTFPIFTDTFVIKYDPNFWNLGDYIQGSRTTTVPSITSMSGTLGIVNSMTCGTLAINVTVNGKVAGTVTVTSTSGNAVPLSLTFAAITGPTYVLRYQAGNTIKSGCGSLSINEDTNKLTLK